MYTDLQTADAAAHVEDRIDELIIQLLFKGRTMAYVSRLLGYAGGNGPRDLANWSKGRSRTITPAKAVNVLRQALAELEHREGNHDSHGGSQRQDTGAHAQSSMTSDGTPRPVRYRRILSELLAMGVPFGRIHEQLLVGRPVPSDRKRTAEAIEAFVQGAIDKAGTGSRELQEGLFRLCLRAAVEFLAARGWATSSELFATLPAHGKPATLSAWYHVATKAGAYEYAREHTKKAAEALARMVQSVLDSPRDARDVRLWLMSGAGSNVYQLLDCLKPQGPGSDRSCPAEVTLVDWKRDANDFHAWAIPCAKVRRGNVHTIIKTCDPSELPHVVFFNYTTTTTWGQAQRAFESGSWPGCEYGTLQCMRDTAASCRVLLDHDSSTCILLSFATALDEAKADASLVMPPLMEAAQLEAVPVASEEGRRGFAVFRIVNAPRA